MILEPYLKSLLKYVGDIGHPIMLQLSFEKSANNKMIHVGHLHF
jgi:hypothetical protein